MLVLDLGVYVESAETIHPFKNVGIFPNRRPVLFLLMNRVWLALLVVLANGLFVMVDVPI